MKGVGEMICFICNETVNRSSACFAKPSIGEYIILLNEDYTNWLIRAEQLINEGYMQVEICSSCQMKMLLL
jgi:hypothetical protein